jgi:rhodanese-related sulfurtransferase
MNMLALCSATGFLFFLNCANSAKPVPPTLNVDQVKSILDQKQEVLLLDVRTPAEFSGELGHLDGALLIPVQEIEARYTELEPYKDQEIIVYCRSGNRSGRATDFLQQRGFRAANMKGGMLEWRKRFGKKE